MFILGNTTPQALNYQSSALLARSRDLHGSMTSLTSYDVHQPAARFTSLLIEMRLAQVTDTSANMSIYTHQRACTEVNTRVVDGSSADMNQFSEQMRTALKATNEHLYSPAGNSIVYIPLRASLSK